MLAMLRLSEEPLVPPRVAIELGLGGQLDSGDMGSSLMQLSSISMSEQISGEVLPSREDPGELQSCSADIMFSS